jgi:hypothetical protein
MPIVYGKPGSLRFRGLLRAQAKRTATLLDSILAYNAKLQARVPAQNWLSAPDKLTLQNAGTVLDAMLLQKNP